MRQAKRRVFDTSIMAALAGLLAIGSATTASAVVLDDTNRITVVLGDGTQVVLLGEAVPLSAAKTRRYYYLPVGLRLGMRPDGTPEFLFLKYTTEKSGAQGGLSGGLMHFLMEWGLTPKQEQELRAKLKSQHKNAELMGAVPLSEGGEGSFQIVSATVGDKTFAPVVVTSGKAPLLPGGKAAAATRLTAEGAQLLAATFEKARSITDLSIALNYSYQTLVPAAKGRVIINWTKLLEEHEKLTIEYSKRQTGRDRNTGCVLFVCWSVAGARRYAYSHNEIRDQYKFLEEKKVIQVQFDETLADERVTKIREAFFEFFLNKMANPVTSEEAPPPAAAEAGKGPTIPADASRYRFKQESRKYAEERRVEVFSLSYRLAVKSPVQIVGNLASWYKGVQNNPKCVAAVNLNDPFFQHRDISFILDLDAKEMFDEAVNYVTVNVRKKRTSGNPFLENVTIDAKYVKEHGINATVTYARGEDKNSDGYEYQAQWSLKGGNVFPANPSWLKGNWEGVTLAPPVVPRTIEVEGDLEAMKTSDVTRVTVQIHYSKFGQEVEENIHISPAANEPLVSKRIFMDRGAKGYAYRFVVNHKTEGKLVLPWSAKVGDDYVYAAIPEELLAQDDNPLKAAAKELGKSMLDSTKEKVLDKFKELLGGDTNKPT
jgi:hypothetical protein